MGPTIDGSRSMKSLPNGGSMVNESSSRPSSMSTEFSPSTMDPSSPSFQRRRSEPLNPSSWGTSGAKTTPSWSLGFTYASTSEPIPSPFTSKSVVLAEWNAPSQESKVSMRKFNVDRMRRHMARDTPDSIIIYVDAYDIRSDGDLASITEQLFGRWKKKMEIKHERKNPEGRIDIYQEFDIDFNRYRVGARIRFIQTVRSSHAAHFDSSSR